jgi:hypothetical protein
MPLPRLLFLLNPVRHSLPIPLVSPEPHENAVHVGSEYLIGADYYFPLIRADYHWPFAGGQARQGQRPRQE